MKIGLLHEMTHSDHGSRADLLMGVEKAGRQPSGPAFLIITCSWHIFICPSAFLIITMTCTQCNIVY